MGCLGNTALKKGPNEPLRILNPRAQQMQSS